ncbi:MAG: hypothetical protein JOZ25_12165, partial [Actinobacteria bacterium]|nr:hypothetical protein [Actinomycetota bacterium]
MLATVSALVAFDAWPRGVGGSGVDNVSVTGGADGSALLVRAAPAIQHPATAAPAPAPAPAGYVKVAAPAAPSPAGFAAGYLKTVGPGGGPSLGPLLFSTGPGSVGGPVAPGAGGAGGAGSSGGSGNEILPGPVGRAA